MDVDNTLFSTQQSTRFLYLYALAVAGGAVAYVPFLTILLPTQVMAQWGGDALTWLARMAFAGAIAASLANILFGWASDRTQMRRPWIVAGMIISSALLPAMPLATSPVALITLIVIWQFGLNMMLAPLAAWAGDCVPDSQKGLLGGLMAIAPALGGLSGSLVTVPGLAVGGDRLIIVALLVLLLVSPVLLFGRPINMPQLTEAVFADSPSMKHSRGGRGAVIRMWLARLFIQIAEASLFAFLLLWFKSVAPGFGDNEPANIFAAVLAVSVIGALIVGRWSDTSNRPILPLGICASIAAAGLVLMAVANTLPLAIAGYVVFGLSSSIFLALHTSQTLRVLPTPQSRGRHLGLFNLTNTVPSLIMPWLTVALVPTYGFDALFILLALLAILAALMLLSMPRQSEC